MTHDTPRIYVACLAAYNNGKLHGAWIDANRDEEDLAEAVAAILADSLEPDAEEYAIHDTENLPYISEFSTLDDVTRVARLVTGYGYELTAAVTTYIGNGYWDEIEEALTDRYIGHYDSLRDYAAQYVDDSGIEIPDLIACHIDYESLGECLSHDLMVIEATPYGVHLFYAH